MPRRIAALAERLTLLAGGAVLALLVHPTCDLLYDCGCQPVWAGGVAHCNIHSPTPPHCPWCHSQGAFAVVVAVIIGVQALTLHLARRRFGRRLATSLPAVLIGTATGALIAGLGAALVAGYPTLLGLRLR